jgi:WD40 repeat protein
VSNAALSTLSWQKHPSNVTAFASNTLQYVLRALQGLATIRTHALHVYQSALGKIPQSLSLDTVAKANQPSWLPRHLPSGLTRQGASMRVLEKHSDGVTCFAYSADGARIVSSSRDGNIRVWDAITFEQLAELECPHSAVHSVSFSLDGKCIISSADDQTVRVWNAVTFWQLGMLKEPEDDLSCVRFSSGGKHIVSGPHIDTTFCCVAFSSDSKHVVSGSHDGTVRVWDTQTPTFTRLGELHGHEGKVTSVAISPDYWFRNGRILIGSASQDLTLRIWNADTFQQLAKLVVEDYCAPIVFLAFSPKIVAIFSRDEKSKQRAWMHPSNDDSM